VPESGASATSPAESWLDLARESRRAALYLVGEDCPRSAVSRAYYAAYARISHELLALGVSMPPGRNGPSHSKLRVLILDALSRRIPDRGRRAAISDWVGRLYALRVGADYMKDASFEPREAREAASLMRKIFDAF